MKTVTIDDVKSAIRDIPDFPVKGILFRDITTALKQPDLFEFIVNYFYEIFKTAGITKVACIESRGFIVGGALAYKLNAGFVPIRKPGKLPSETYSVEYELEYGSDSLEIHTDAFQQEDIVLVHDDLLATGGTAEATFKLIQNFGIQKTYFSFICELDFLNGAQRLKSLAPIHSMFKFE